MINGWQQDPCQVAAREPPATFMSADLPDHARSKMDGTAVNTLASVLVLATQGRAVVLVPAQ